MADDYSQFDSSAFDDYLKSINVDRSQNQYQGLGRLRLVPHYQTFMELQQKNDQATQSLKDNALSALSQQGRQATILTSPLDPQQGATLLTQPLAPKLDPTKNQNGNLLDPGSLLRKNSVI